MNYGIRLFTVNSDHLIENNIIRRTRHSLIIEGPANGVVFGYNSSLEALVYNDFDWVAGDGSTHGAHPFMNLFEGNVLQRLSWDYSHGSASHNTAFRNHFYRDGPGKTGGLRAVELMRSNTFHNVVGNVLCLPGCQGTYFCDVSPDRCLFRLGYRSDGDSDTGGVDPQVESTLFAHGNFDYLTHAVSWDPTNSSHNLPASLYHSAQPAWWPAGLSWPPFGPHPAQPANVLTGRIPAQVCYETIEAGSSFDPSTCYTP